MDNRLTPIPTWADVLNRANLGFEVIHERNSHGFPLDLASNNIVPIALKAPAIG
jgi:photosystem II P680 reaction center D1 protein